MSRKPAHKRRDDKFAIDISNQQSRHLVDEERLCDAVRAVLRESGFASATVSIAVVDDPSIHELNRQYLDHDWPTDVLSFVLEERDGHLEGEVIISADMAATTAVEAGWAAAAEQLLYVVHGTLHLVGYRDKTSADAQKMRAAEAKYLRQFGFVPSPGAARRGATAP
ncbi:MAG: rRNA maturation RNase YbeY [Pirellulales bacterium]